MSSRSISAYAYFKNLRFQILNNPFVLNLVLQKERVTQEEGFNKISVELVKNYRLEVFEYFHFSKGVTKYRYQLLDGSGTFIARWDNAPHHNELKTFPHHFHSSSEIGEFHYISLIDILNDIKKFLN